MFLLNSNFNYFFSDLFVTNVVFKDRCEDVSLAVASDNAVRVVPSALSSGPVLLLQRSVHREAQEVRPQHRLCRQL